MITYMYTYGTFLPIGILTTCREFTNEHLFIPIEHALIIPMIVRFAGLNVTFQ